MINKYFPYFFSFFIFIAHFVLLFWMIFVLKNAGHMTFNEVLFQFIGLALFGGALIYITAKGTKYIQGKEWKLKHQRK